MEAKKQRSPRYPSLDFETAVDKVRAVQSACGRAAVDRETLAKCMGYSSLSGTALGGLASLSSYGLLEKRGKGEAAVTDLAMQILFAESAEEHAQAARQAALSPVVFSQIADKFGGHAPHKEVVISFLRRNGFTENAAAIAVRTYVNSMEYVESLGDNERSDSGSENAQDLSEPRAEPVTAPTGGNAPMMSQASVGGEFRELVRGDVGDGNAFRLLGKDKFNAEQLQDIIDMLELQMKIAKRRAAQSQSVDEPSAADSTAP